MPSVSEHPEAPTTIQTHLAASFVSLELSRSIWLITSLSPGSGEENIESIPCEPGTSRRCWRAFRSSSGRRRSGPENPFRSSSFRKWVSTASGFIGCCKAKASKAMSSIRRRSRRRAELAARQDE